MKTLIAGANLPLPAIDLALTFNYSLSQGELDLSAYLLAESTGKVRGDQDMIFYGQKRNPNDAISLEISTNRSIFRINTAKIDPEIEKIKICATLDRADNFTALEKLDFQLENGGQVIATAEEKPTTRPESAMILAEVYRYKGAWKCRWVMQGFQHFQLKELAEHFGVEIADDSAPTPEISSPTTGNISPPPAEMIPESNTENLTPPPAEITLPPTTGELFPPPAEIILEPPKGNLPPPSPEIIPASSTENLPSPPDEISFEPITGNLTPPPSDILPEPTTGTPPKKITLDKLNCSISLEKKSHSFGLMKVNLNWNQNPITLNQQKPVDLDLGAIVRLKNGKTDVVQALGNRFGALNQPPFAELQGDDRTGESQDGEWLFINGQYWEEIKDIFIYCYIYKGVPNWAATDGVVQIDVPEQESIVVHLNEGNNELRLCCVARLTNDYGNIYIEREMQYFLRQSALDEYFQLGLNWKAGRKKEES